MGIVRVEGMQFYAYHGCLPEEARTGRNFTVDVEIETDFSVAAESDDISGTVDYAAVYAIVKREMEIRSKLIEHVARRIHDALRQELPRTGHTLVTVSKMNPPVNGVAERAAVVYTGKR